MTRLRQLLLLCATFTFVTCENHLTRDEAAEALREGDHTELVTFEARGETVFKALKNAGLIAYDIVDPCHPPPPNVYWCLASAHREHFAVTQTGRDAGLYHQLNTQFGWDLGSDIVKGVLCSRGFGEVTGMREGKYLGSKITQVDYTRQPIDHNPVYDKLIAAGVRDNRCNSPESHTAVFALYDDGWRLESR